MVGLSLPSFYRLQAAGWIKPSLHTPRLTLFETTAVQQLWERIKKEGLPKSADLRDDQEASRDAG